MRRCFETLRIAAALAAGLVIGAGAACDYLAYDALHSRTDADAGLPPACPTGFDECDQIGATVCETDLASSPDHCGECNAGCDGASCTDGWCDAALLAPVPERAPSGLTAIDEGLVWATDGGTTLRVWNRSTGAIRTLLTLSPAIAATSKKVRIVADGTHVYWVNDEEGIVRRTPVATPAAEVFADGAVRGLGLHEGELFWLTADGALRARPVSGAAARDVATGLSGAHELVAGSTGVYWQEPRVVAMWSAANGVKRNAEGAFPETPFGLSLTAAGTGAEQPMWALVQDGSASWRICADYGSGALSNVGCSGVADQPYPRDFTFLPKTGFDTERNAMFNISSTRGSDAVGFIMRSGGGPFGSMRGRIAGAAASELAIDERAVYWANIETGYLYRMVR